MFFLIFRFTFIVNYRVYLNNWTSGALGHTCHFIVDSNQIGIVLIVTNSPEFHFSYSWLDSWSSIKSCIPYLQLDSHVLILYTSVSAITTLYGTHCDIQISTHLHFHKYFIMLWLRIKFLEMRSVEYVFLLTRILKLNSHKRPRT